MADLEKGNKRSPSGTSDRVTQPGPTPKGRSNCLLGFCRLVNFLTAVCALLCAVAHGMALMVGEGSVQGVQALTQQVLRLYGVGFAVILVCAELEWERFLMTFKLYRTVAGVSLLTCSFFYILGGLLCFGRLHKARYKREAECMKVQEDLAETERKRTELKGLLAMYSNE